jgi:putative transposase
MERKISFVENEFYHVYNRGVDKRIIFTSSANYRRFMMLLYLANDSDVTRVDNVLKTYKYEDIFCLKRHKPLVAIGAFCLMPNHFHLLVTPLVEGGISKFMLKLQTGYAMYFNKLKDRSGALFQGPFQSVHVDDDIYLKYLFAYIHLNPAKLKDPQWKSNAHSKSLLDFVTKYSYSSLREYLSEKPVITSNIEFPKYFKNQKELISSLTDWLNNSPRDNTFAKRKE